MSYHISAKTFQRFAIVIALALGLLSVSAWIAIAAPGMVSPLAPGNPIIHPPANDHTVPPTSTISITYDEPISPTTVDYHTFAVHAMSTGWLTETFNVTSGTITLIPTHPFKPGELVQVSATTATLGLTSGEGPSGPTVWQFRAAVSGTGSGNMIPHPTTPSIGNGNSVDVTLGDLDNDGDLDAVVANDGDQSETVWLNDGTGSFSPHLATPSFGTGRSYIVALGDLDSDNDLDAVVANHLGQAETVWQNDGIGNFSPHPTTPSFGGYDSVGLALGDLDGDGDLDAVVANTNDQAETVWVNDGMGNFTPHPSTPNFGSGYSNTVVTGDLDGDGDLDVIISNSDNQPETVWLNDGAGNYTPHPTTPDFGAENSRSIDLGDLDSDGDLDAVVANQDNQAETVWLNDGVGNFTPHPSTPSFGAGDSRGVTLGDLDGDGDLDAIIANRSDQTDTIWLNDGSGNFKPHPSMPTFGVGDSRIAALGDLDGDGDLDAIVAKTNDQAETVWLNEPLPLYVTSTEPPGNGLEIAQDDVISATFNRPINATSISTRTFTVRGAQTGVYTGTYTFPNPDQVQFDNSSLFKPGEVVVTTLSSGVLAPDGATLTPFTWQFRAAVDGGTGNMVPHPATPEFGAEYSVDIALGDIDGDGDLDAALANGEPETVWLNDGMGNFTPHPTTPEFGDDTSSFDIELGDLDGDGDLDAIISNHYGQAETVWLNDGAGNFAPHPTTPSFGGGDSWNTALGDIDGDGDLDALVSNSNLQPETVWVNDGAGNFSPHPTKPSFGPGGYSREVVLGDLDKDGDLDAVVAKRYNGAQTVWLNDGIGNFWPHPTTPGFGGGDSTAIVLGDLDQDGDLDAIVGNRNNEAETVWLNDGLGKFNPHPTTPSFGADFTLNLDLGDLDGDSDLDIVVSNGGNPPQLETIWLNDGLGNFSPHPTTPAFGAGKGQAASLGDIDGDGDLDTVISSVENDPQTVWLNQNNADLEIAKTVTPTGILIPGDTLTFTLAFTNHGPEIATGVIISDIIPVPVVNTVVISSGVSITTIPGFIYAWQVADLNLGEGGTITVTGIIDPDLASEFTFTNTTIITGTSYDLTTTNNTSSVTSEINIAPNADAGGPYSIPEGSIVTLDASGSSDPGDSIVSYEWDLDDDGSFDDAFGITVPCSNTDDGVFPIALRVTDEDGATDVATTTVTVSNVAPMLSGLQVTKQLGENDITTLSGIITDPGILDTFELLVDWGDGISETYAYSAGAETFAETHQYLDDDPSGTPSDLYTITLTLTDDDGGNDVAAIEVIVNNLPPTVDPGTYQIVERGQPIYLSGSFTDIGTLDTHTVIWDFGDGSTLTGTLTPSHTYKEGGIYTVTLIVIDDDNGVGMGTLIAYVNPIYTNDFEEPIGSEWCDNTQSITPSGRQFLGEFGNQTVCLQLDNLPENIIITVSFDLFVIRSWDGNEIEAPVLGTPNVGPDEWEFRADGVVLLHTTFSNWSQFGFTQAYPGAYPGSSFKARTGAVENNTLGYSFTEYELDSVYHLRFTSVHISGMLLLDFSAMGLQPLEDESWGLDNISIYLITGTETTFKMYLPAVVR